MNIKYIGLGLLLSISSFFQTNAQTNSTPKQPKLIVGITIDHLRGDYFEKYSHLFLMVGLIS